jgi:hypothetical protein
MKSIRFVRTAIAVGFVVLLTGLSPGVATAQDLRVTLLRNGQPLSPKSIALTAATGIKDGNMLAANLAVFDPTDAIAASLDGKPVGVYVDECDNGEVRVHLVAEDPNVLPPPEEDDCNRRRLGAFIFRRGARIVVDVARGTVVDTSSATTDAREGGSPDPRSRVSVFGFGSGSWGAFNVGTPTRATIDTRFNATTPPYNPVRQIDVNERGSGVSFGGGVNVGLGAWLGLRAGVLREGERDTPTQDVQGERSFQGLRFQQQGNSEVRSTTFFVGPTLNLPGGVVLTGGPAWTNWNIQLTQTAQLQALCPNPCLTVRTDNLTETSKGTDLGVFVGGEYYPGDKWIGLYAMYLRTTYQDAYAPDRPLGYPRNWTDSNAIVGAVIRTHIPW